MDYTDTGCEGGLWMGVLRLALKLSLSPMVKNRFRIHGNRALYHYRTFIYKDIDTHGFGGSRHRLAA